MNNPKTPPVMQPAVGAGRSKMSMRVGFVGVVAVAVLGGFAAETALIEPAGPQSPEEALEQFFEAAGNEDLIGMAETLLPSEREAFIDPTRAITDEVERLEIFGEAVEIDTLGTLDITVEGLTVASSSLAEGFAIVSPTGGTISVAGSTDDLPLARVLSDWVGDDPKDLGESIDLSRASDRRLVAVEHEGSWYLSLTYTWVESLRGQGPLPAFGAGLTPVGGDTPEQAIQNFFAEVVEADLSGVLTQLDPHEMRAVYDYAPLFLENGQAALDEVVDGLHHNGATWEISDLELRSEERRGRTVVLIDGIRISGSFGDNTASIEFRDHCVSLKARGTDLGETNELLCQGDDVDQVDELDALPEFLGSLEDIEFDTAGVTVVERDGRWYISTVPSVLYLYVDVLVALDPGDVENLNEGFRELRELLPGPGTD